MHVCFVNVNFQDPQQPAHSHEKRLPERQAQRIQAAISKDCGAPRENAPGLRRQAGSSIALTGGTPVGWGFTPPLLTP